MCECECAHVCVCVCVCIYNCTFETLKSICTYQQRNCLLYEAPPTPSCCPPSVFLSRSHLIPCASQTCEMKNQQWRRSAKDGDAVWEVGALLHRKLKLGCNLNCKTHNPYTNQSNSTRSRAVCYLL